MSSQYQPPEPPTRPNPTRSENEQVGKWDPQHEQKKEGRLPVLLVAFAGVLVFAIAVIGGCVALSRTLDTGQVPRVVVEASEPAGDPERAPLPPAESEPPDPPAEPEVYTPKPSDWKVTFKIRSKQCFGDAGCNITYLARIAYVGSGGFPDSGAVLVTYDVIGVDGGPFIESAGVSLPDMSVEVSEGIASVPSKNTEIKGKVTSVEYDPYG